MRSDLTRNPSDPRWAECGNGEPRCHLAPAPGDNPLRLCDGHLSEHRARCGIPEPAPCPACNPCAVWAHRRYITIVGALCFACDRTNGGTVPSEAHRREAAGLMRARLLALWREGDRGPEWAALMARCPERMREAFARRMAATALASIFLLMSNANGTYEILSSVSAIVEVTYSNGTFGIERVTARSAADLYEVAYAAASVKATVQGERLDSFRLAA